VDRADEMKALDDVRRRLQEHFPQLDADVVEAAVRLAHSELRVRSAPSRRCSSSTLRAIVWRSRGATTPVVVT
jgi:hypothetical protein